MSIAPEKTIKAVEEYFETLKAEGNPVTKWAKKEKSLEGWHAVQFFLRVMLDQKSVDRAVAAAEDFVKNRDDRRWSSKTFWKKIAEMSPSTIRNKCVFNLHEQYHGTYAKINKDDFPVDIRENARKIIKDYKIVEKIWEDDDLPKDNEKKIEEIYKRFKNFEGIRESLAAMAVSLLVKDYGYAGGIKSQKFLKIKLDKYVKSVIEKAMLAGNEGLGTAKEYVKKLNKELDSPADFSQMLLKIGKEYCQCDDCCSCPIHHACNTYQKDILNGVEKSIIQPNLYIMCTERKDDVFKKFSVCAFEINCFAKNEDKIFEEIYKLPINNSATIIQHDAGISIENNNLECTLRLEGNYFILNFDKFGSRYDHVVLPVYPYIGEDEVIFEGDSSDNIYKFYMKLVMEPIVNDKLQNKKTGIMA